MAKRLFEAVSAATPPYLRRAVLYSPMLQVLLHRIDYKLFDVTFSISEYDIGKYRGFPAWFAFRKSGPDLMLSEALFADIAIHNGEAHYKSLDGSIKEEDLSVKRSPNDDEAAWGIPLSKYESLEDQLRKLESGDDWKKVVPKKVLKASGLGSQRCNVM